MNTENLKSHLIDQYSIFGEYKKTENRVTCALLHIINYCGLVRIFEGEGTVNDNKDKNGRSYAFMQRQRYTIIEKIVNAKYTSQH